jgi:parallel beta-helix repeat protein
MGGDTMQVMARPGLPFIPLILLTFSPGAHAATFHVSIQGSDTAQGTAAAPWRTLQHSLDAVKPGDSILVGPGTYRERIEVRHGGTAEAPLTVSVLPGARVIVSGADLLADGWKKVEGLEGVYSHDWVHRFPINGPNDLTHPSDREHELTGRAEQVMHNGRLLRQVLRREQLAHGTFFVDLAAKKLLVHLRDDSDPSACDLEASVRTQWLAGGVGVSHVHVRGLTFRYAANHAQRGAFWIGGKSRDWVVEDCVFERANGPGASFTGRGHIIRRCVFQDNGQLGFGAYSCHDTRLEQCDVYRNNVKGYSTDWEAGGLKVSLSRGFALDRCRVIDNRGPGIWYDIGNEKAEVAHCRVADNDEAGIFYEISYGLRAHDNLVVNNANLTEKPRRAWGFGGITLSSSEDCELSNNTLVGNRDGFTFREQNRTTPRIDGGERRILNRNHVVRDNVVASSQGFNIAFWMDTTFFGPHPNGQDKNKPIFEDPKTLGFVFRNNVLHPLPGRSNYLYGCSWRPRSKMAGTPAEFTALSGIADSSRVDDPRFQDLIGRDYDLRPDSPAVKLKAGVRNPAQLPPR